jgi:hypothetical protein
MNRAGCRWVPAFLGAVVCLAAQTCPAPADHTEHREFVVIVDGKEAGQSHLMIVTKDDGSHYVKGDAKVKFTHHVLLNYSYSVEAQEWWKDGRLVGMQVSAVEDGTKTDVTVSEAGGQLRMQVNKQDRGNPRPDAWPSSYWKLADKKYHNQAVPILDADTGKELTGQLQYVATEPIKVGPQAEDCYHFRITGIPVPIELWFDKYHRLVRQEFTESGHRTIVQLISVRRP